VSPRAPWALLGSLVALTLGCAEAPDKDGEPRVPSANAGPDAAASPRDGDTGPSLPADAGATDDAARTPPAAGSDASSPPDDGGAPDEPAPYQLDCGRAGIALESAGPPLNRVNYVIVGDGYSEAELDTTYRTHLEAMLRVRFAPESEVFVRYRKFVNICALRTPSPRSGIGESRGDSAFGGYGNDQTRLGYVDDAKVRAAVQALAPRDMEVDWTAVVLNGDRWWNAGGALMVWSGGHPDAGLAAIHEGGHSFFRLADEYGGSCTFSGDEASLRINVTKDRLGSAGKWQKWLDFEHAPGTGKQGIFEGAQYCDRGAYRPTQDSVMNSLWRSAYLNAISREQAVRILYDLVDPIDEATPSTVTRADTLEVRVIDPAVIDVEWTVDEGSTPVATGARFDVRTLDPGTHRVRARAVDRTDWVRGERQKLEQVVSWTLEVP
jgi:IgA Peptidase M64